MTISRATFVRAAGAALAASAVARTSQRARADALPPAAIDLGDDVFVQEAWRDLGGRRVGIVANQASVTSRLDSIVDAIRANPSIRLTAIFAPEHGLRGDRPAGSYVASYIDPRSSLPVYSLYGATRKPNAAMLAGVDVLLVDLQDVGDRAYTYVSTMASVMQAAKEHGKAVWVLDRPNPIGGAIVEGPVLDPRFSTFIGLYPIALRHGMTIGELARAFNDAFGIGCSLRVIPMRRWRREMLWEDTGLVWVPTSPNIPDAATTLVYPATGVIDNAGINNGVGTAKPFWYAGGYGVDGYAYARRLNALELPGVFFRPANWSPFAGFWAGKDLSGVELVLTQPHRFLSVRTGLELIAAARAVAPSLVRWKVPHIDRDWGTDTLRNGIENGASVAAILAGWQERLTAFRTLRERYLLY